MKIVVISDTHTRFDKLVIPECDLLISCGDYSNNGTIAEVVSFHKWLNKQPAKYKISVQGNHERGVQNNYVLSKNLAEQECPGVFFIDEGLIVIKGIRIWCSAITPEYLNWAWNRARGEEIKEHWDKIPNDIDILVTHGPPYLILDKAYKHHPAGHKIEVFHGCVDLLNKIRTIPTLKHHFFGHIHESHGNHTQDGIMFWNAAICNSRNWPVNPPTVVEFVKKRKARKKKPQ